ncbi:ATP-binding protein [uncultured Acetobacteroides sp.]|uniref:ATP-binding protein n=1 Tax=uncultured Acetobacteroides sp. TaxID=1760811 RepID=UPI0029F46E89|nr:ATP-binding protein [uncultured Acetobacteroides sp.]
MRFTYNPRVIKQLGTELITSDSVALTELIKNSYDAKASQVNIFFLDDIKNICEKDLVVPIHERIIAEISKIGGNLILIEDNGIGMDEYRLQKGFFEIGSDIKETEQRQANGADLTVILGNKGIGRLSAQRLSPILFVETTAEQCDLIKLVKVNWVELEKDANAEAQNWDIEKSSKKTYTRLWLLGLPDQPLNFSKFFHKVEEQSKDLFGTPYGPKLHYYKTNEDVLSKLNFLYSPFEVENNPISLKIKYNSTRIKTDFNKDNLTIAESLHKFKIQKSKTGELILSVELDIRPWFIQRIHHSQVGDGLFQDYKKDPSFYRQLQHKYRERYNTSLKDIILISSYLEKRIKRESSKISSDDLEKQVATNISSIEQVSPIEGEIYSFKRDRRMLELAYNSAKDNGYISNESQLHDIKAFLEAYNGVKLYRNGFRIANLGDKSSDWLKLQQKRTTGQQFYRFELGNALGYVKINDPKQEYISETSSREDITDRPNKKTLSDLLDYIFNECFYYLTRNAVGITKDILDEEGLIPRNQSQDIERESNSAKELLVAAEKNLSAFSEAFKIIRENKDLDSEIKINTVKNLLDSVDGLAQTLGGSLQNSFKALRSADTILTIAHQEKKRIEVETYNNYKLMANGLVTEVITHELHSLIQNDHSVDYEEKINLVKKYLFEQNNPTLYKDNLFPVKQHLEQVSHKMSELQQFYNFLEKTFVYSGKTDDFEQQNLKSFLVLFEERNKIRLDKYKIDIDITEADQIFSIPRGAFMHMFYNLFDNSIYWIGERQSKAIYDKSFQHPDKDKITIRVKDGNSLQYFDSGIGVLDKYQYTLFQPLVSGKENGRGMGMYIVRKFLESFDAKIELLNDRNKYGNRYIFEVTFNSNVE